MPKRVDIATLVDSVYSSLDNLSKTHSVIKVNQVCYIYKTLRFSVENNVVVVRSVKIDRDNYCKVYEFERSRRVRAYYYKTSLLLSGQIDEFCKICLDEVSSI